MHAAAYQFVAETMQDKDSQGWNVLEVGSRNVNGTTRPLFARCGCYIGIDKRPGPDVDVIGDAVWYARLNSGVRFDAVVCCEVLEHDAYPDRTVEAIRALLKPGGLFILTCAGPNRPPHGCDGGTVQPGEWYRNITEDELCDWLRGWGFWRLTWNRDMTDLYLWAVKAAE